VGSRPGGATVPSPVQCTRNKIARVRPCRAEALGGLRKRRDRQRPLPVARALRLCARAGGPAARVQARGRQSACTSCELLQLSRTLRSAVAIGSSSATSEWRLASVRVLAGPLDAFHRICRERDQRPAQAARRPVARNRFAARRSPRPALNRFSIERQSGAARPWCAVRMGRSCLAELNRPPQVAKHRARSPGGGRGLRALLFALLAVARRCKNV